MTRLLGRAKRQSYIIKGAEVRLFFEPVSILMDKYEQTINKWLIVIEVYVKQHL